MEDIKLTKEQYFSMLAMYIDRMEPRGGFMHVFFKKTEVIDGFAVLSLIDSQHGIEIIKSFFKECGITEIISEKPTKKNGDKVVEYMFELNYKNSAQHDAIDELLKSKIDTDKQMSLLRSEQVLNRTREYQNLSIAFNRGKTGFFDYNGQDVRFSSLEQLSFLPLAENKANTL